MATQSNLEKIGIERRQNELVRNQVKKSNPYSVEHQLAKSTEGQALGKGTGNGYSHATHQISDYNELTKNRIVPQIDTENCGGEYDINGYNGNGGRKYLQTINKYGPNNPYGADNFDLTSNEDQYYIK